MPLITVLPFFLLASTAAISDEAWLPHPVLPPKAAVNAAAKLANDPEARVAMVSHFLLRGDGAGKLAVVSVRDFLRKHEDHVATDNASDVQAIYVRTLQELGHGATALVAFRAAAEALGDPQADGGGGPRLLPSAVVRSLAHLESYVDNAPRARAAWRAADAWLTRRGQPVSAAAVAIDMLARDQKEGNGKGATTAAVLTYTSADDLFAQLGSDDFAERFLERRPVLFRWDGGGGGQCPFCDVISMGDLELGTYHVDPPRKKMAWYHPIEYPAAPPAPEPAVVDQPARFRDRALFPMTGKFFTQYAPRFPDRDVEQAQPRQRLRWRHVRALLRDHHHSLLTEEVDRDVPAVAALVRRVAALPFAQFRSHEALAFLSGSGMERSMDRHSDSQNLFIFQLRGRKRWVVHAPARLLLPVDRSELVGKKPETTAGADELGPPALNATIVPGDVLYLPAGSVHATSTAATDDDDDSGIGSLHVVVHPVLLGREYGVHANDRRASADSHVHGAAFAVAPFLAGVVRRTLASAGAGAIAWRALGDDEDPDADARVAIADAFRDALDLTHADPPGGLLVPLWGSGDDARVFALRRSLPGALATAPRAHAEWGGAAARFAALTAFAADAIAGECAAAAAGGGGEGAAAGGWRTTVAAPALLGRVWAAADIRSEGAPESNERLVLHDSTRLRLLDAALRASASTEGLRCCPRA